MANEIELTQEEKDSLFPPSDPARYEAWYAYQCELGARDADDPTTEWIPHEEVMRDLRERMAKWREQAARRKNVA